MPQPRIPSEGIATLGDHHSLAALGMSLYVKHVGKFGVTSRFATGDAPTDIIPELGLYKGQPADATPEIIQILHPNGADNSSSTGMKTVQIVGLKTPTSTEFETETITLTGTATDSVNAWWRIVSLRGKTFGSGGTNAGTITARSKVTVAEVFAVIAVGHGRSQISVFTAPYGTKVALKDLILCLVRTSGAAGSAQMHLLIRESGSGGYTVRDNMHISTAAPYHAYANTPKVLNGGDDLIIRCIDSSDSASTISCQFDCFIINPSEVVAS